MATLLAMLIFSAASISKVYGDAQDKSLTLTRLVSQSSQGAVAFRDRQSAENILGALQAEPQVKLARLLEPGGLVLAEYAASGASRADQRPIARVLPPQTPFGVAGKLEVEVEVVWFDGRSTTVRSPVDRGIKVLR